MNIEITSEEFTVLTNALHTYQRKIQEIETRINYRSSDALERHKRNHRHWALTEDLLNKLGRVPEPERVERVMTKEEEYRWLLKYGPK